MVVMRAVEGILQRPLNKFFNKTVHHATGKISPEGSVRTCKK